MEVDHFDPRTKKKWLQKYDNLFLALGHCNRFKGDYWPSKEEVATGIRLLNPCEEQDYGEHIFEDPMSHELVGTPLGKTQIIYCDLNDDYFVAQRRQRSELISALKRADDLGIKLPIELLAPLQQIIDLMIPEIDPPPPRKGGFVTRV